MDLRYQVKQWLGVVTTKRGVPWIVFTTGDAKWWLFCQCFPRQNCLIQTGVQCPVAKKDVVKDVKYYLLRGINYDMERGIIYQDRFELSPRVANLHTPQNQKRSSEVLKKPPPVGRSSRDHRSLA